MVTVRLIIVKIIIIIGHGQKIETKKIETMTTEDMTKEDMIEIKIRIDRVGKDQEVKRVVKLISIQKDIYNYCNYKND